MIDYILIAGILLYFVAIRWLSKGLFGPVAASVLVTVGLFGLTWTIRAINMSIYGTTFLQTFGLEDVLSAALTFTLLVFVFRKIQRHDNSYTTYIVLGISGAVGAFYILPVLLRLLFSPF